jgi:divalent metal cation (Fe/Co/Zn/Cd) transporter
MTPAAAPPVLSITYAGTSSPGDRDLLIRSTKLLAWASLGWHLIEAGVAVTAAALAGSVALAGFGVDSLIEAAAGLVVVWLMTGRSTAPRAERRAQQLIATSFLLLAAYLGAQTLSDLIAGSHPGVSWLGVALSIVTVLTMPTLAVAKRRLGVALGSAATVSESRQTMLCAYLSAGLLVGLLANAIAGWWWADLLAAVAIGGIAVRESRAAWRGESCGCC